MSLRFSCTSCQAKLRSDPKLAGKRVKCPKCKQSVPVPLQEPATSAGGNPPVEEPSIPSGWQVDCSQGARDLAVRDRIIRHRDEAGVARLTTSQAVPWKLKISGVVKCRYCLTGMRLNAALPPLPCVGEGAGGVRGQIRR